MKIAIVYDSITGNTKMLADAIYEKCEKYDACLYKEYDNEILNADLIFIGSWTDKGLPSDKIKSVYEKIKNKKVFVFGTCGFGGNAEYYKKIFDNTLKYIDSSNVIVDYYFCSGKMPLSIKNKYEKMLKENPGDKRISNMLDNFNNVLNRPNSEDLDKLKDKVAKVINEG